MLKKSFPSLFLLTPLLFSCAPSPESPSSSESPSSGASSSPASDRYAFGKEAIPVSLPEGEINPSGVGYEIFVGSFADSNGDGIGDLNGITEHLDYLSSLGVTYLWLTPIYPSGTYHHYDVEDYFSIAPEFGTMEDFSRLCLEAKKRGMLVVLDMVLNHASKNGAWFNAALDDFVSGYSGPDSYKDDFVFYSSLPSSSASRFYSTVCRGQVVYYEANFDSNMPEFNLDDPTCKARQKQILDFWLQSGASGFRFDGVYYYFYRNDAKNVEYLKEINDYVLSKRSDAYMVAEVWPDNFTANVIKTYSESGMTLFNFMNSVTGGSSWVSYATSNKKVGVVFSDINFVQSKQEKGTGPVFFLSNHDQDRLRSYFAKYSDPAERLLKRKLLASYCLLTPGTPFLYYGEEIDLGGTRGNASTDANRRLPFLWKKEGDSSRCLAPSGADYSGDQAVLGALDEEEDPNSLLSHYKALIALRGKYPFIAKGAYSRVSGLLGEDGATSIRTVGMGRIESEGETYFLVHNESSSPSTFTLPPLENAIYALLDGVSPDGSVPSLENGKLTLGGCASILLKASTL